MIMVFLRSDTTDLERYVDQVTEVLSHDCKVDGYKYSGVSRCLYIALSRCEPNPESMWRHIVEMLIKGINIEKAWILEINSFKALEVDIRSLIPRIQITRDPLLEVEELAIKSIDRGSHVAKECIDLVKTFTKLGFTKVSKVLVQQTKCSISLRIPKTMDRETRAKLIKSLRKLQFMFIKRYRKPLFLCYAMNRSGGTCIDCFQVLEL